MLPGTCHGCNASLELKNVSPDNVFCFHLENIRYAKTLLRSCFSIQKVRIWTVGHQLNSHGLLSMVYQYITERTLMMCRVRKNSDKSPVLLNSTCPRCQRCPRCPQCPKLRCQRCQRCPRCLRCPKLRCPRCPKLRCPRCQQCPRCPQCQRSAKLRCPRCPKWRSIATWDIVDIAIWDIADIVDIANIVDIADMYYLVAPTNCCSYKVAEFEKNENFWANFAKFYLSLRSEMVIFG